MKSWERKNCLFLFSVIIFYLYQVVAEAALPKISKNVLPVNVILALEDIKQYFPEFTQLNSSGINLTAVGSPMATRGIIYTNPDKTKKIILSVDQYKYHEEAFIAYREAIKKSKAVPRFKLIPVQKMRQKIGESSFIGTASVGPEKHIGLGVLYKNFITSVTMVGFEPSSENLKKLIELARKEFKHSTVILKTKL